MFIVVLIVYLFLEKIMYGCFFYMIGGNWEVVRLVGIFIDCYCVYVYMISGLLVFIGGIILCSCVGIG